MSDARYEPELVHVWRHSFRPSQPFGQAIERFIKPGKTLPRLLLYGSKEAAVNLAEYNRSTYTNVDYNVENEVVAAMEGYIKPIHIDSEFKFRSVGATALRIAFRPAEESLPTFDGIMSTLNKMPNILYPLKKVPKYFMYIDIPYTHLVDKEEWDVQRQELASALGNNALRYIYSVHQEGVEGQNLSRIVVPGGSEGSHVKRFITERPLEEAS